MFGHVYDAFVILKPLDLILRYFQMHWHVGSKTNTAILPRLRWVIGNFLLYNLEHESTGAFRWFEVIESSNIKYIKRTTLSIIY